MSDTFDDDDFCDYSDMIELERGDEPMPIMTPILHRPYYDNHRIGNRDAWMLDNLILIRRFWYACAEVDGRPADTIADLMAFAETQWDTERMQQVAA